MKYLSFTGNPEARDVLLAWWEGLQENHGDRATLRRCRSNTEVAFVPAYHRLRLTLMKIGPVSPERLATVAGVLSYVKTRDPKKGIAQQLATPKDGSSQARVSGLRFRRLLAIEGRDGLYGSMIRIVRLLNGAADIPSLADGLYWWNERTKNNWAFDYYSEAPDEK